jgi:uncharacterized protein YjbI with pentapeptide repeats
VLYPDDFADWKPHAEVMVKGAAYPPGGAATECSVGVSVGWWKKNLVAVGPRVWRKRMIGSTVGEPAPFERMPLSYESAFGGAGFAANPVGRGHKTEDLPCVVYPADVAKTGKLEPASFMPLNPRWPQRAGKRGKKYGKAYQKTRAPFYAEDFDWTYFNAAPKDQQLEGYLQGDEAVVFENMHPQQSWWETQLPGLRLRVFVKDDEDRHHEVRMHLDTLFADLDAGRLYLTWRGMHRVRELDLTDVTGALVAAERLAQPPQRAEYYRELLDTYMDDPVGLKEKIPAELLEWGKRLEEEEAAELAGQPIPIEERVDPFGLRARMAQAFGPAVAAAAFTGGAAAATAVATEGLLAAKFPPNLLRLAEALKSGEIPDPEALVGRPELDGLSEGERVMLNMVPVDKQATIMEELVKGKETVPSEIPQESKTLFELVGTQLAVPPKPNMPASDEALPVEDPRPGLQALSEELAAKKARLEEQGVTSPLLGLFDKGQRMIASAAAMATSMLDAPRGNAGPDLSQMKTQVLKIKEQLADSVDPEALGKLDEALAKIDEFATHFPPAEAPSDDVERDFAGQDLRGKDLSDQDLAGKSFARADLAGANLEGANLTEACFDGANLTGANLGAATLSEATFRHAALIAASLDGARLDAANLSGAALTRASLVRAVLTNAILDEAVLEGAQLQEADLSGASLREATLTQANLEGANLSGVRADKAEFPRARAVQARLVEASLAGANLAVCDLSQADLSRANLVEAELGGAVLVRAQLDGASLESARLEQADLSGASLEGADLRFAQLTKAKLERASLRGADLSLATVDKVRADGVDLSDAKLEMTTIVKARLRKAKLGGAKGLLARFDETDLQGADAREADLSTCDLQGANLAGADFSGATLERTSFRKVTATQALFVRARITCSAFSMGADLSGADFNRADGQGSIWQDSVLDGTNFAFAKLPASHFQNSKGKGTRFDATELKGAFFRKAALQEAVFNLANLCSVDMTYTNLLDVQFQKANCYEIKLLEAQMAGCDFANANVTRALLDDGVSL